MSQETPIELIPLPQKLHEIFDGRIAAVQTGPPEEREKNFLSRALAAYAIHELAGAPKGDAAASIVDGGGDGGIDAVHFAASSSILWLVQSKFIADGRGEPRLADAAKFKAGVDNLLDGRFEAFEANAEWAKLIPTLRLWFEDRSIQVRAVFVYSGLGLVSPDRRRLFDASEARFNADDDYLKFITCNLTTVHDWLTDADANPGVESIELRIGEPGRVGEPFETVYGTLTLADLAEMHKTHGRRLIAANIRGFKGRTDVNAEIVRTVGTEPEHFFYLNNGLTAYCSRLEVHALDRGKPIKRYTAHDFSIVNGAQTLGAVAHAFAKGKAAPPDGRVFIRIISLERCEDDHAFAERITRATNLQNQVGIRDFAAQLPQHAVIARQLGPFGIAYHYKPDAGTPKGDEKNFDLHEAVTACACLHQSVDCDFVARALANRNSLLSPEFVRPASALLRSRLEEIFPPGLSGRTVWRAVQAQRIMTAAMRANASASTGVRKAFYENARWLLLNVVFLRWPADRGEELNLNEADIATISHDLDAVTEALFETCLSTGFVSRRAGAMGGPELYETPRHFRSVFSAPGDCRILRNALLARLSPPAAKDSFDKL